MSHFTTIATAGLLLLSFVGLGAAADPGSPPQIDVSVQIPEPPTVLSTPTQTPSPAPSASEPAPSASPSAASAVPALADQIVPVLNAGPSVTANEVKLTAAVVEVGKPISATVHGYTPGEKVRFVVYSTPMVVGDSVATTGGDAAATFAVPKALAPGIHTLEATGWVSHRVSNQTFVVAAAGTLSNTTSVFSAVDGRPWIIWAIAGGVLLLALIATWIAAARRSLPIFQGRPTVTTEGPEL